MLPGMRLRWDRIGVLLATLALLLVWAWSASSSAAPAPSSRSASRPASRSSAKPAAPQAVPNPAPGGCPASSGAPLRVAPGTGRTVALTFDDGPGPWTPPVLAVLARYRVTATFFMIGRQAAASPEQVRDAVRAGHLVGDHSWRHVPPAPGRSWDAARLADELAATDGALHRVTGQATCWFRPPEGIVAGAGPVAQRRGMRIGLWSIDTLDWKVQARRSSDPHGRLARDIAVAAVSGAGDHPVVLMHDGGGYRGGTVAALPSVISFYRANGYRFVRLDGRE